MSYLVAFWSKNGCFHSLIRPDLLEINIKLATSLQILTQENEMLINMKFHLLYIPHNICHYLKVKYQLFHKKSILIFHE